MSFARSGVHPKAPEKKLPYGRLRVVLDECGGLLHVYVEVKNEPVADLAKGILANGIKFEPGNKGGIGSWTFTFASDIEDGDPTHRTIGL